MHTVETYTYIHNIVKVSFIIYILVRSWKPFETMQFVNLCTSYLHFIPKQVMVGGLYMYTHMEDRSIFNIHYFI